jgi:hypothetical protein
MKHLALLVLAASATFAAVDPTLLSLLMPDAKVVAGVQVDQARASAFGQYVLSQALPGRDFDKLSAETGFDPRRDLREIVAGTAGPNNQVVLIGCGVFQPARIVTTATTQGATVTQYRGVDLIFPDGANAFAKGALAVAFLDASTAAIGPADSVRAAVDRFQGGGGLTGALSQKARELSSQYDAWVATTDNLSSLVGNHVPNNFSQTNPQLLQAIQQFSGGVRLGQSTVSFGGEAVTRSSQDAQALADLLKFVAEMAQNRPPDAAGGPNPASLLSSAQFTTSGATTRISVEIPEKELEQLVAPKARANGRRPAAVR